MRIVEVVVDSLPTRLWKPANLYMLPLGQWHFCVGGHSRLDRRVRTVEWRGRQAAEGRRAVDIDERGLG